MIVNIDMSIGFVEIWKTQFMFPVCGISFEDVATRCRPEGADDDPNDDADSVDLDVVTATVFNDKDVHNQSMRSDDKESPSIQNDDQESPYSKENVVVKKLLYVATAKSLQILTMIPNKIIS